MFIDQKRSGCMTPSYILYSLTPSYTKLDKCLTSGASLSIHEVDFKLSLKHFVHILSEGFTTITINN